MVTALPLIRDILIREEITILHGHGVILSSYMNIYTSKSEIGFTVLSECLKMLVSMCIAFMQTVNIHTESIMIKASGRGHVQLSMGRRRWR